MVAGKMNKIQIVSAIKKADITQEDWLHKIIDKADSEYAKGYFNGCYRYVIEKCNYHGSDYNTEIFRQVILKELENNAWDKITKK